MRFVILGCGRVGAELAGSLAVDGHDVAVIDKDPRAFRRLGKAFAGTTITGVGFDRDVLLAAGIEQADGFASVTNGDNSNIVSALIARREFRVPRVITRIYDPQRADIYKKFGIPTISSTTWGANELREHLLYPELESEMSFGSGEVLMIEFEATPGLTGHTVGELEMPGQAMVICIERLGRAILPDQATVFEAGDMIHANVAPEALSRFKRMAGFHGGGLR